MSSSFCDSTQRSKHDPPALPSINKLPTLVANYRKMERDSMCADGDIGAVYSDINLPRNLSLAN